MATLCHNIKVNIAFLQVQMRAGIKYTNKVVSASAIQKPEARTATKVEHALTNHPTKGIWRLRNNSLESKGGMENTLILSQRAHSPKHPLLLRTKFSRAKRSTMDGSLYNIALTCKLRGLKACANQTILGRCC